MPDHGGGEAGHAGHRLQEDDARQDGALVQRLQVALHGVAGGQVEAEPEKGIQSMYRTREGTLGITYKAWLKGGPQVW